MDMFPRDFTLKHSHSAFLGDVLSIQWTVPEIKRTITLSKLFHVRFISTLKSGSPLTPRSLFCSVPQAQWRGKHNLLPLSSKMLELLWPCLKDIIQIRRSLETHVSISLTTPQTLDVRLLLKDLKRSTTYSRFTQEDSLLLFFFFFA